jgi:hypothetical protein
VDQRGVEPLTPPVREMKTEFHGHAAAYTKSHLPRKTRNE